MAGHLEMLVHDRLARNHSYLKPQRSSEERALKFVPDEDGKLPSKAAGKRIPGKVCKATRGGFVSCRFDAVEHNAYLVSQDSAVSGVEEVARHRGSIRLTPPVRPGEVFARNICIWRLS